MELQFLRAELAHLTAIVELLADDPLGARREDHQPTLSKEYISAFDNIQKDTNQELMVVKMDNQIVGTFQLSFIQYLTYTGGIRAQLEGVRVGKDYRNKGIGESILDYCITRAKERNAHLLQLTTDKQRPEAIKFYASHRFEASHEGMKLHF